MRQDLNINKILSPKYPDASREPYCFNLSHFVKDISMQDSISSKPQGGLVIHTLIRVLASGQWDWSPGLVGPWARYRVIKKKKDFINSKEFLFLGSLTNAIKLLFVPH